MTDHAELLRQLSRSAQRALDRKMLVDSADRLDRQQELLEVFHNFVNSTDQRSDEFTGFLSEEEAEQMDEYFGPESDGFSVEGPLQ
jgi:hypothetical protein